MKALATLLFVASSLLHYVLSTETIHFVISSYIAPDKSLEMELDITAPRTPGTYPAMLYLTGLEGIAPNWFQATLINDTVKQGHVWLTLSRIQKASPEKLTDILKTVMTWLDQNLASVISNRVPGVKADITNQLILMGHSAAGHSVTQFLNGTCGNAKMLVFFSPVDGVDPFGIRQDYIITPGKKLPFAIPSLILATELDQDHKVGSPPCAPNNLSNLRFYDAMSGPKWFLNASKYGHCDFFDTSARQLSRVACASCKSRCNFPEYREMVLDMLLSFIKGILKGDRQALEKIENGDFKVPSIRQHDYMGYGANPGPFCKRVPITDPQLQQLTIQ